MSDEFRTPPPDASELQAGSFSDTPPDHPYRGSLGEKPPEADPVDPPPGPEAPVPLLENYGATIGLILLITIIYAVSSWPTFRQPNEEVLALGVFEPELFREGQWWRLVTANLLHADLAHLFNNLFGILIFGHLLEPALGRGNMIGLFLTSGLMAMLFSYWFLNGATLGASGIDFGLIGAYITLILLIRRRTNPALFRQELRSALMFVLIFGVWNWMEIQHVNLWGHLGGLVGGVLFVFVLLSGRRTRSSAPRP